MSSSSFSDRSRLGPPVVIHSCCYFRRKDWWAGASPRPGKATVFGHLSLDGRSLQGDMIDMNAITQGMDRVDRGKAFSLLHSTKSRGQVLKLNGRRVRTDTRM